MALDDRLGNALGLLPEDEEGILGIVGLIEAPRTEFLEQEQLVLART